MYVDLHVHSKMSDGTLSPSEVIGLAIDNNLTVIALTDHDTLDGISEAKKAAKLAKDQGSEVTLVPGVEISVSYNKKDVHVLGLFVDESCSNLQEALTSANQKRHDRNEKMAANFRKDGIPITIEELQAGDKNTIITRAHFAGYLVKHGYAKNIQDAFNKFLVEDKGYYVRRQYPEPEKSIDLIHGAKGLAFIAHPFLYGLSMDQLEKMIVDFKEMGLDGIEALHSSHSSAEEKHLKNLADKYDLLISGGSDFHGATKPGVQIGTGKGNMKIPYSIYENLKNKKVSRF